MNEHELIGLAQFSWWGSLRRSGRSPPPARHRLAANQFLYSVGAGTAIGVIAAVVLLLFFHYYLLPDELQNPFSLSMVVAAFTVSDFL